MKRYRKKELFEIVETLLEANDVINRSQFQNAFDGTEILTQCQELAYALGMQIENFGENYSFEYKFLVRILEEYCETVYQMSLGFSDIKRTQILLDKTREQLIELNNGIRDNLPKERREVVFLPYKASMWDSLESVWEAAAADENTDVYVIPIPYFDKNPNGSFGEEHYESDLYPSYVPITSYEEYDFEERKPNLIFIHNPYDNNNHVTSVHPFFYSNNLKQFTEKLVYIPYFILEEINPDNRIEIESIKHFCVVSGVLNADQVIVQSENMKQAYLTILTEAFGNTREARNYWEKKIAGLGSPKLDKVLNTRKEDLVLPNEWLKIIKRSDGSWKKIILYNTSITALLQNDENMLTKMEDVFEIFKEHQADVSLLWRPHPLIQATISSMRPLLWKKYLKLVEKYRMDGWGIYDDTADLNRAIAVSDAYYGDQSSVVQLYKYVRKPIMIQNIFVTGIRGGISKCQVKTIQKQEEKIVSTVGKHIYEYLKNV